MDLLIPALFYLASIQDPLTWEASLDKAFDAASGKRGLVVYWLRGGDDDVDAKWGSTVSTPEVTKALEPFVRYKEVVDSKKKNHRGYAVPHCPAFLFLDSDGKVMGQYQGLCEPLFLTKWTNTVHEVWRKHNSLVFRARGLMSERDSARLAFSWASRLETDKAKSRLAALQSGAKSEEADMAWMALALAWESKNDLQRALECWTQLEVLTRSPETKAMAKCGIGDLIIESRPQQAKEKYAEVEAMNDVSSVLKWRARHQIEVIDKGVSLK